MLSNGLIREFKKRYRQNLSSLLISVSPFPSELLNNLTLDRYIESDLDMFSHSEIEKEYARSQFITQLSQVLSLDKEKISLAVLPAGKFARNLVERLDETKYEVVSYLDNFLYKKYDFFDRIPLSPPGKLCSMEYDKVLIATPNSVVQDGLRSQLVGLGIPFDNIVLIYEVVLEALFAGYLRETEKNTASILHRFERMIGAYAKSIKVITAFNLSTTNLLAIWDLIDKGKAVFLLTGYCNSVDHQIMREELKKRGAPFEFYYCSFLEFVNFVKQLRCKELFTTDQVYDPCSYDVIKTLWQGETIKTLPAPEEIVNKPLQMVREKPVYRSVDEWLEMIREIRGKNKGHPAIMFVGNAIWHSHMKLIYTLKKNGILVILLLGIEKFCGAIPISRFKDQGFFDLCIISGQYATEMPEITEKAEVDLIHVLCHVCYDPSLAEMLKTRKKKVIVEYTDFIEIMFKEDAYNEAGAAKSISRFKSKEEVAEDWETVFTNNDGIIYKESPKVIEYLSKKYQHKPSSLEFHSYLVEGFSLDDRVCLPIDRKYIPSPSIVFIGSVLNDVSHHHFSQDSSLFKVIDILTSQGIYFAIFNAIDDGSRKGYQEYVEIAEKTSLFDYYPAIPQNQLKRYLSKFDIALQVLDYRDAQFNPFFLKTTFATRFFNFLEAGLPIIMSDQLEYMSEMIKRFDIGIGINFSDLNNLRTIIDEIDWEVKRENIRRLLPRFSMECNVSRLLNFYNEVCNKNIFMKTGFYQNHLDNNAT